MYCNEIVTRLQALKCVGNPSSTAQAAGQNDGDSSSELACCGCFNICFSRPLSHELEDVRAQESLDRLSLERASTREVDESRCCMKRVNLDSKPASSSLDSRVSQCMLTSSASWTRYLAVSSFCPKPTISFHWVDHVRRWCHFGHRPYFRRLLFMDVLSLCKFSFASRRAVVKSLLPELIF